MANRGTTTYHDRCDKIAGHISVTDTHWILKRILALVEQGEQGESIMQRLNPPARQPAHYRGWFVGDD